MDKGIIRADLEQLSSEELLAIWKSNDLKKYKREAFPAIQEILTERSVNVPDQSEFINPKPSKKFLKFLTLLALISVVLVFANPSKSSYVTWLKNRAMENSTGLQAGIMTMFAESMISSTTIAKDYLLWSTFTTTWGDDKATTLGILNQFIIIGREKNSQVPTTESKTSSTDVQSVPQTKATNSIDLQNIPEGMYEIGKDIPFGEYRIISDGNGFFDLYSSSDPTAKNYIVDNGIISGQKYLTVRSGQYLEIKRAHMVKVK